ncbi:glucose-1-phosphate adenylyltransferase [Hoyosella subflava]|uniref:Glucose-1-phosphate adenylyltransferase n=1 Tax=Hoyosella subflava (strain DSM 45089 / JCM 17490 / NBRC 109087 / DQS3-9A1) TaxID=443218 RepID=F6EFH7_HOYSD|nr:glucose-1-phosphate adenylyltransferase [Hoyosella subflava]AEF39790.1 Glucose-1-phosphate adenylyltransferase [Hoyosella subflava DQS3-9A1]
MLIDTGDVLAIVLAGGEGKRLMPLTADRAKPAVPFGGTYRLIDFALSNLVNAGIRKIVVLTQYKSHSLDRHVSLTWRLPSMLGDFVAPVPAQQRTGPRWFAGSADAIYQSLNLIYDERPKYVAVFGADHIYRIDPRDMLAEHVESGAAATVAAIRVPIEEASQFGVIETDQAGEKIAAFREKPSDAIGLPDAPNQVYASMGNYVFTTEALVDAVKRDATNIGSSHDMGGDIIPAFVSSGSAYVYDFATNYVPGSTDQDRGYWRDVGTIDSYYAASMDVVADNPGFNLYNYRWPILSHQSPRPPAKVVSSHGHTPELQNTILAPGAILAGARVNRSLVSPDVRIGPGAEVDGSVLFNNVVIGAGAVVRNAILDKNVVVPPGATIGVDLEEDSAIYTVSKGGVVVVAKQQPTDSVL